MTKENPPIPTIDDAILETLFTSTGEQLKADDFALAEQEQELAQKLNRIRAQRAEHQISLRALNYVDDVHNGVALTVRPMVLDLKKFLTDPHSSFSAYIVPKRYEEAVAADKNGGGMAARMLRNIEGEDKPQVKPLSEARVIAIFPSTVAMSVWVKNSMPMKRPDAKIVYPENPGKAIILGFESGWYLFPLSETGQAIIGNAYAPSRQFRYYKTRDGVMKAAYEYATSCKLSARKTIPSELENVYQQYLVNQEKRKEWHAKKRAEREANGEEEPDISFSMFRKKEEGEPENFTAWHA